MRKKFWKNEEEICEEDWVLLTWCHRVYTLLCVCMSVQVLNYKCIGGLKQVWRCIDVYWMLTGCSVKDSSSFESSNQHIYIRYLHKYISKYETQFEGIYLDIFFNLKKLSNWRTVCPWFCFQQYINNLIYLAGNWYCSLKILEIKVQSLYFLMIQLKYMKPRCIHTTITRKWY